MTGRADLIRAVVDADSGYTGKIGTVADVDAWAAAIVDAVEPLVRRATLDEAADRLAAISRLNGTLRPAARSAYETAATLLRETEDGAP